MTTPRRKVGNIPLPRPLRIPEQDSLDLNQNVFETSLSRPSRPANKIQEAENKAAKGAFTYDVRCFGGIFDLSTYPNQILY